MIELTNINNINYIIINDETKIPHHIILTYIATSVDKKIIPNSIEKIGKKWKISYCTGYLQEGDYKLNIYDNNCNIIYSSLASSLNNECNNIATFENDENDITFFENEE